MCYYTAAIVRKFVKILAEVIFLSELQRMMSKQATSHSTCLYSNRMCVVTKTEFRYYKSKESYLRMQKPLRIIPLSNIIEVNFVSGNKKRNSLDHFYIKLEEENFSNISKISNKSEMSKIIAFLLQYFLENSKFDISLDKIDANRSKIKNTNMDTKKHNSSVGRKIKLINNKKENNDSVNNSSNSNYNNYIENFENQERTLIFSSDKEELINNWVTVLNYLII